MDFTQEQESVEKQLLRCPDCGEIGLYAHTHDGYIYRHTSTSHCYIERPFYEQIRNKGSDNVKIVTINQLIKKMKIKYIQVEDEQKLRIVKRRFRKNSCIDTYISFYIDKFNCYDLLPSFICQIDDEKITYIDVIRGKKVELTQ